MELLPRPQKTVTGSGSFTLPQQGEITLVVRDPSTILNTATRLQHALQSELNLAYELRGGQFDSAVELRLDSGIARPQGYRLTIADEGVTVIGGDESGLFYGICTLIQIVQSEGQTLPQVEITDYPDFPNRGVMLDISRNKVPSMETLVELVDLLASWKVNQIQLYTEHAFAYRNHGVVWAGTSPMTPEQILHLDAFCQDRYIELVPNQNSFGHLHRWFEFEPYNQLAETDTDVVTPWGTTHPPFSLSPAVPGSLQLVEELYAELLPNFSSTQFNVGCDETFDLGMGKTKAWVEEKGKGRVYLDFVLEIYQRVKKHGRTMQFWGDIINQYPDLVPELPRDTIALEWGYEADHDFAGHTKLFADSGIPFYVCPGTSSWNTIAGRTDNCLGNIRNAIENGHKNGAIGVLNTDWGDRGHWQQPPISYLGFAYGAGLSWCDAMNQTIDLPAVLDAYAFHDRAGIMGKLVYELGNAYLQTGVTPHNSSVLFSVLQSEPDEFLSRLPEKLTLEALHTTMAYIDEVAAPLGQARMTGKHADLLEREMALTVRLLRHGVNHALLVLGDSTVNKGDLGKEWDAIQSVYRELWLARNRPGGLEESVKRFEIARAQYR